MKKMIGLKGLCCLLVINFVCLLLAGCGADGSGDGQNSDAGDPANSPNGRRVMTAVVTQPSHNTLERISACNESNSSYFTEIKEYGAEGTIMEANAFPYAGTAIIRKRHGTLSGVILQWKHSRTWLTFLFCDLYRRNEYRMP